MGQNADVDELLTDTKVLLLQGLMKKGAWQQREQREEEGEWAAARKSWRH